LNTAGGTGALANVDETVSGGVNNTAFGDQALLSCTTGAANTATGTSALLSNTTGRLNTASGFQALQGNTEGDKNTAVDSKALKKSTGTQHLGIGYQAGVTLTTGNNNNYIGNLGNGDESQTIRIGTAQAQTFIAGINSTNLSGGELVAIDPATGQLGVANGRCTDAGTKTHLLFTFVTNINGFDTGVAISNTTADTFGTTHVTGTCTLKFFGAGPPTAVTTPNVNPGTTYANVASSLAPGFQGYMIATCNFPLAHGFAFISDIGARNL